MYRSVPLAVVRASRPRKNLTAGRRRYSSDLAYAKTPTPFRPYINVVLIFAALLLRRAK
jgi:hypothetical protein